MSEKLPGPDHAQEAAAPIPQLVREPQPRLLVDGEPFLILGLQWDCNSCYTAAEMVPLFAEAARLGCNTAVTPVYWQQVEPEPGQFDFGTIDLRLAACREAGLRLVLLWFAGYKNAECCYAPQDIREDHARYRKVHRADGSLQTTTLCPTGGAALERDCVAFRTLMAYLIEHDSQERTVIMVQPENEAGIMGADRCYCPDCTALFEQRREHWSAYGNRAGEAFCAASVARYCNTVAATGKAVYPLPMYANAWLGGGPATRPGFDYPSGGPVSRWLAVWQEFAPALDLLAPDIYLPSVRQFAQVCAEFGTGNPLYIAEAASGPHGRAERNVFYALGVHGAIGFDPWAIDRSYPDWFAPPFVRRHDLTWSPPAHALRDSYVAIGRALRPLARAQGTDRLATFVQEEGEIGTAFQLGGVDFRVHYEHPAQTARGIVIVEENMRHFLVIGTGFLIRPYSPAPEVHSLPLRGLERGSFVGDRWVATATVTRETARGEAVIRVEEGSVHRFELDRG